MKYVLGFKKLPFEQDIKQIIYVEGEYNEEVNRYIQNNYSAITRSFKSKGYEFCYLPFLGKELACSASLRYYAPFAKDDFNPNTDFKSDFLLQWMVNRRNKKNVNPSLLYYHPKSYKNDYVEADKQFLGISLIPDSDYDSTNDLSTILKEIDDDICFFNKLEDKSRLLSWDEVEKFKSKLDEDERKEIELMETIAAKYRNKGIDRCLLATMTYGIPEISPLLITKDYRIILTANNQEVILNPLPKTLFLFYLNHKADEVIENPAFYINELQIIYERLHEQSNNRGRKGNVGSLSTGNDCLYDNIYIIKKAFRLIMDDHIASNYYVDGKQNKPQSIKLPRELVTWECDKIPLSFPQIPNAKKIKQKNNNL